SISATRSAAEHDDEDASRACGPGSAGPGLGEEGARLLASKSLLNRYAVEGRDLTLQYNIYNVGSRASNVSHTVVLRPLKAGYFNFTSASVSYLAQEGGQVLLDWAAFGVMTLPSIGIPLLLWYSSKRKYDSPKAKKN
ncbi:hypothetical protein F7725_025668, partial [Dissostichus mawsoni]